jgi:hypothetical protein
MGRSTVWLAAVLCTCACAPGSAYDIECAHLYSNLRRYVRSSDAWPALQDADACMADAFIRKSLMHVNASTLAQSGGVFHLTNDSFSLAELLAFSLIGRHFVAQDTKQVFFFDWNRLHRTLSLELLPREFSRPLYTFVLLGTLLTILCIVVLQEQVKKAEACETSGAAQDREGAAAVAFRKTASTARLPHD